MRKESRTHFHFTSEAMEALSAIPDYVSVPRLLPRVLGMEEKYDRIYPQTSGSDPTAPVLQRSEQVLLYLQSRTW
jgi:hypothetical protein